MVTLTGLNLVRKEGHAHLLWALGNPNRLDTPTRAALEDTENTVFFSAASLWEIAIKARLGRVDFSVNASEAALQVEHLPLHHRDPFDRLLVAQAIIGPLRLYTADSWLRPYSELVTVIS